MILLKKQKQQKKTQKKQPAKYSRMIQFHRDENTLVSYADTRKYNFSKYISKNILSD